MEIDSKQKFEAVKALMDFVEKTGFNDFFYDIDAIFSGNTTCYELTLLNRQRNSVFAIRVKIITTSEGTFCETEIDGNTIKPKQIERKAILEAIDENIKVVKIERIKFLEKISK